MDQSREQTPQPLGRWRHMMHVLRALGSERADRAATAVGRIGPVAAATPRQAVTPADSWQLYLDGSCRVLHADWHPADRSGRLREVMERLPHGTAFAAIDPSIAQAFERARRFGCSGLTIVFVPDALSQVLPIALSMRREGEDAYVADLLDMHADMERSEGLASLDEDDLQSLAAVHAITAADPISDVFDGFLPLLLESLHARGAAVIAYEPSTVTYHVIWANGCYEKAQGHRVDAAISRKPKLASHFEGVSRGLSDSDAFIRRAGLKAGDGATHLVTPLVAGGRELGLLVAGFSPSLTPDEGGLVRLEVAAQLLAARLWVTALQDEADAKATSLETAYAVTKAISGSIDLDATLRSIATNAARVISASGCLLLELDDEAGDLAVVASSEAELRLARTLRFSFGSREETLAVVQQRTTMVIEDIMGECGLDAELYATLSMRSTLFVPLVAHGAPIGSLLLYSRVSDRRYTDRDIRLAEDIADRAAIAIQNARLYDDLRHSGDRIRSLLHRVSRVREEEREEVAAVVHDEITQAIVGATYELETLSRQVSGSGLESAQRCLEILRGATRRSREIISSLRPSLLDELGLQTSVRTLAADFEDEVGVRCRVVGALPPKLPADVEKTVYRVIREALTNVKRHADASTVLVELSATGEEVRATVVDDGRGFKGDKVAHGDGHFGILMMQEQAAARGGRCSVASEGSGKGVRVTLAIPVHERLVAQERPVCDDQSSEGPDSPEVDAPCALLLEEPVPLPSQGAGAGRNLG